MTLLVKVQTSFTSLGLIIRHFGTILGIFRPLGLVPFLAHPNEEIRWEAADTLSMTADSSVIEPVFDALQRETDGNVIKRLVWALETAKAWDKLLLCLDSPNWYVQHQATQPMIRNGDSRFVLPLLDRMVEHGDPKHTYYGALSKLVDESSVQLIMHTLEKVSSAEVKGRLLALLGHTKDEQVFDTLMIFLNEREAVIRDGAALGLMHLGDTRAIGSLQKLLTDVSLSDSDTETVRLALHELERLKSID